MKKNKSDWFFRKEKLMKINRIMRLTLFMLVCINLSLSAKVYSQTEKFSVHKQNATVKEIFDEIMQQSNYHFFYNNEFDVSRKVSINVRDAELEVIVKKVLEGQGYSYKLMDNYVIIKRENIQTEPQNKYARNITGTVKDTDGNPLPGVTIRIPGTSLGVATDIDGKFFFAVPGPGSLLEISFVGKKTLEIVVGEKTHFDIVLEEDKKMLEEVVCTGIQTISRERATGAFEILNSEDLGKTLTSDVVSRFQGKIAGVQVNANNKITIRGRGSINSNTDPLIVVDGFPIESGIESVNPDDIVNMTVLKDAAAASIWGVRAANGVIVITTKSGQNQGKPTLDVSYFLTVNSKEDYKDMNLLSPADAVDLQLEQIQKGWWNSTYVDQHHQSVNKVQETYYSAMQELQTSDYSLIATNPQFWTKMQELRSANLYKQFEKELLRRAVTNRLNLSFRGGTEKSTYYMSAVYDHQASGSVGTKSDDLMLNLKHDYKILNRLTFSTGVNIQYQKSVNNGIDISRLANEFPFHNLWDNDGKRIKYYMVDPWEGKNREEMGYLPYTTNLLDEQETNDNTTNVFSARIQAALKWNVIRGLDAETRFQYERTYNNTENLYSQGSPTMRQLINDNTIADAEGMLTNNIPMGARYDQYKNELEAWTWRSQLTYNGNWNDSKHALTAVLGHEMRMYRTIGRSSIQFGYDPTALTYIPIDETAWANNEYKTWYGLYSNIPQLNNSSEADNRDISVFLNAAYTFADKYSISASGRIDQSNLFGNDSDYKYNFIWSGGLSWRISEESFAKTDWMDQLLVRVTYGIGGNINKNFFPMLMGSKYISANGVPYIQLDNPANKDLTWEKSTTFNAGIDFAFVNHRIGGSVDYYHKKGTDLLGRVSLDPTNGFDHANMNFASVLNQGIELTLNTTPLVINDFRWNLGFNISYNKNEVTKVESEGSSSNSYLASSPAYGGSGVAIVGKPLGRMYSYRFAGLNDKGEVMLWEGDKKVHFADYNRNIRDLKYEGTVDAPYFGGVNTSFEYKGITLSANATYKFGHKFRLPVSSAASPANGYKNIADRWRKGNTDTNVPTLLNQLQEAAQYEMDSYYSSSDIHVRDAAFLRLNEVTVGYTLPRSLIHKTPFKLINLQFQIRNLALWTANKENVDPEAIYQPRPKSFIAGVKLNF